MIRSRPAAVASRRESTTSASRSILRPIHFPRAARHGRGRIRRSLTSTRQAPHFLAARRRHQRRTTVATSTASRARHRDALSLELLKIIATAGIIGVRPRRTSETARPSASSRGYSAPRSPDVTDVGAADHVRRPRPTGPVRSCPKPVEYIQTAGGASNYVVRLRNHEALTWRAPGRRRRRLGGRRGGPS